MIPQPDGGSGLRDGGVPTVDASTAEGLTVRIVGAPSSGGNVTITGPNDYSEHLTTSTTLVGLSSGTYTIRSRDIAPGKGTRSKANPADTSVSFDAAKGATVTIDYSTSGFALGGITAGTMPLGLWFTEGSKLVNLQRGLPSGNYNADFILDLKPAPGDLFQEAYAIAFDALGGVWLADTNHQAIERIGAAASVLGEVGVIDLTSYKIAPYALSIDKTGNLWVAGQSTANELTDIVTLLGFGAEELLSFRSTPAYAYTNYGLDYTGNTESMAFDAKGLLWIGLPSSISLGVLAPTLHASGSANLAYVKDTTFNPSFPKNENQMPTGIAFDGSGNLWVTNRASNEVVGYKAAALGGSFNGLLPEYHIDLPAPTANATTSPVRLSMDICLNELYVLTNTLGQEHVYTYDLTDPTKPNLVASITSPDIGGWQSLEGFAVTPIPIGMPLHSIDCATAP
jgi:hypothetical protein